MYLLYANLFVCKCVDLVRSLEGRNGIIDRHKLSHYKIIVVFKVFNLSAIQVYGFLFNFTPYPSHRGLGKWNLA